MTVTYWMRTSRTGQQAFLSIAESTLNSNDFLIFLGNNTDFRIYDKTGNISFVVNSQSTNQWIHHAVVRDDTSNRYRLYINGVEDNESPISRTLSTMTANGSVFGQEQDSVLGGYDSLQAFNGRLSNLKIYDRLLSKQEIIESMNCMNSPVDGLLLGLSLVENDSPTTFFDNSENGYHAIRGGTVPDRDGPPIMWCGE